MKFEYNFPPKNETKFDLKKQKYERHFVSCDSCGHWFAKHKIDINQLYTGEYTDSTYGNKIAQTFEKIIALPNEKSDNFGRIERVKAFKEIALPKKKYINLLDIGSGLGIFPHAVKKAGWNCVATDPDKRSIEHIQKKVGINRVIHGDFMKIKSFGKYDIITFNKVLEHVEDPGQMLSKAKDYLEKDGFVYIEVPDAEKASKQGKDREEFFIDHLHVFSLLSLKFLCQNKGFKNTKINRILEPSGKFTLFAFISI
jgi:2-polyprenyl-3-methyl-5-hydroxy-6-metoxy-1,4-benzoquinol methylase